ncbi:MAG TPA: DUF92 domain-containing protein [Terriglobales bacterium]|nr:DUF92 domain-containing protein [Terriglobales bacterium]
MQSLSAPGRIGSTVRVAWPLAALTVLLMAAAVRLILLADREPGLAQRLFVALTLTAALALAARWLRAVTNGGALAGSAAALLLFVGGGWALFAGLVALFVLTALGTRMGRARKEQLGTAESRAGRSAAQILANTGAAGLLAAFSPGSENPVPLMAAATAALAEAAADTVSSEYGQAAPRPTFLVTTGEPVPPGTDGGVSLAGTVAGMLAAALVVATCVVAGAVPMTFAVPLALAGSVGMLVDSTLGAIWERRGRLSNDTVNLFGTLSAALLAWLWLR